MSAMCEVKVLFIEGNEENIRAIRGRILKEDDHFIHLERRDGTYRLNKRFIIKIEED
jgi:hypothetical protein